VKEPEIYSPNIVKNNTTNKNIDIGKNKENNNIQKLSDEISNTKNKGQIYLKCSMCCRKFESKDKYCELCIKQRMFDILYEHYQLGNSKIDENNLILYPYIIRYNHNYEKKIEKEEILKNIKDRNLCLFEKEHQKYQQKLPCGCHICNYLIEFLKRYTFRTSFSCKCLKKYSRVDMILLEILFEEIDKVISKNIIISYFNKRFGNCCLCGIYLNNKNNIIKNSMSVPNEKNTDITNFINRNKHYTCDKCIKKVGSKFLCIVCGIKHLINK